MSREIGEVAAARKLYEGFAARDADAIRGVLADDFVGDVSAGMPLGVGGRHEGPDAMLRDVWMKVFGAYDMRVEAEAFHAAGDGVVVAQGFYRGTERASGRDIEAAFAHVLTVRGDRIAALEQITDTRSWLPDAA